LATFFGPDAHRDCWDENQHDERQVLIQLIQVGQVRREELAWPKGRERTEQNEHTDEDVARGAAEVADEVPLEYRADDFWIHSRDLC
jgi:hypothetical protein